ncbi:transmembrane protein [Legionella gratiana]|uniref:Transmembrane protein n=1 Tax=Legionella gratiana TaxID=45066 RepID=A0A378J5L0_9GAMM|nr:hypothetical protein [Legionella gratiana]KTD06203.1 transmembrane protein [Legionella gratiana]STX43074.1 transmembrane protein [Legionella gratiana]
MRDNFFRSFTVTGAAITGIPSASVSGIGSGVSQSVVAAKNASAVLSEKSGQRDSILRALHVLFENPADLDHSALETYLDELREGLIATNDSIAFIVRNALLGLLSGVGHVVQIPSDVASVVKETGHGLSQVKIPTDKMQDASKQAFKFDAKGKGSSVSVNSVSQVIGDQGGNIIDEVAKAINIDGNSHAETHARVAASTGAGASVATTAILPTATALLIDMIGQIFREGSAIGHFYGNESASEDDEKNVYHASSGVSKATQNADSRASKQQLRDLEAALSHTAPAADLMSDQNVTSPLTTALLRLIVLSFFVESSRGINKTAIVTTEGRLQKALTEATAQGPSGGVDRINSIHSNLSFLSNIMRLCAENLGGSPAIMTAERSSEVISSRSMSVLLSHVSELAEALRQLVSPQQAEGHSLKIVNSSVDFANPDILDRSEATIKAVLDRMEQENQQHVIPGLNQDMASQLSSVAHSAVSSLVATHSLFSNPVTLATKASKEAVAKINDEQKNEALMDTLPGMTQMLNVIQASTRNFIAEIEKEVKSGKSEKQGSLLSTHQSVASNTATVYWAASTVALLCDEMLSICRSLTLIDQNRLQAISQKASQVPSKEESAQSTDQIGWDSHLGQDYSATHAITALRLTLSHTGIALMRIALDLHHALKDNMDTVQRDLAMHTLQQSLLTSSAYASLYLAEGLLLSTGAVSASPASLNGSVNWSHKKVHTTDAHLHPAQTHESEKCSKGSSDSSQSVGFSTDLVAGTVTNILKVLAQGSLVGLDTLLRLIKILEIISLHRDSHIALRLETNDSSNPNGLLINTLSQPSVGSSAGTSAILMNILEAFKTFDQSSDTQSTLHTQNRLQDVIDQQIAGLAVLKDDEEQSDHKKGLKEFYKIIIRLLAPHVQASDLDSLIKRLDFGGISLSSYHSKFGAYSEQPASDLRFVAQFANADDAQGILRKFIDKSKDDLSLMKALHDALPQDQRSRKAQILYEHVFEELFQHYKQIKMSDVARHSSTKRKLPTRQEFQSDVGLVQSQLEEVHQPSTPRM